MPLIQRSITIPNDSEAMGFGGLTPSQNSINNFIKDVDQSLVDGGLTKLNIDGSLDVNNIPNININGIFNLTQLTLSDFVDIGYIYYSFNDELQEEFPIYIKFTYGVKCASIFGKKNLMYTAIKLDILRNLDTNDNIFPTQILHSIFTHTYDNTAILLTNKITHNSNLLSCFYNKNNFYLNIFPSSRIVSTTYGNNSQFDDNKTSSYISFYLERNGNAVSFMNLCGGSYLYGTATSAKINFNPVQYTVFINNIINNTEIVNTNDIIVIPMINFVDTLNNNYESGGINPLAFKSILYDKSTKTISQNTNLLCAYKSQIGQTNVLYELDIDNNTKGKYISYSIADNLLQYTNAKTDFLFRYE